MAEDHRHASEMIFTPREKSWAKSPVIQHVALKNLSKSQVMASVEHTTRTFKQHHMEHPHFPDNLGVRTLGTMVIINLQKLGNKSLQHPTTMAVEVTSWWDTMGFHHYRLGYNPNYT